MRLKTKLPYASVASRAVQTAIPKLFSRNHRFVDVAVGGRTACGITDAGDVYCGTRTLGTLP